MDRPRRINCHHAVETGSGNIDGVTETDDTGRDNNSVERYTVRFNVVQERGDGVAVREIENSLARGRGSHTREFRRVAARTDDGRASVLERGAQVLPDSPRRSNDEDRGISK